MEKLICFITFSFLTTCLLSSDCLAEEPSPGKQVEQAFESSDGASVPYLLYLPKDYDVEKNRR